MTDFVTRKEFDDTIKSLKSALESTILQTSIASNVAIVAFSDNKDIETSIDMLEKLFENAINTFHFSPVTYEQIARHREEHSKYISILRKTLQNDQKGV